MPAVRRCQVSVTDLDGVTHVVEVQGATVFQIAAAALAQFRREGWVDTLAPTAVLTVEVHTPPTIHRVPMRALERWANGSSVSPKDELLKRPLRSATDGGTR